MSEQSSPLSNIIYFIILTVIYCIVLIIYLYRNDTLDSIFNNSNNKVFLLIYILFLLSGNYFLNLQTAKIFCTSNEISSLYYQILLITISPWLIIFVLLFLLLELFNGWIKPFSNTIGYSVVSILGVEKIITKLLNEKNRTGDDDPNLKKVFKYINNHNEKFVNEINIDVNDYIDFTEQLRKDKIFDIKDNDDDVKKLYKLIIIKNIIGKVVWYILACLLICSITYNYIINIQCSPSLENSMSKIDELYNDDDDDQ